MSTDKASTHATPLNKRLTWMPGSGPNLGGIGCGGLELWEDGRFRHPAYMNTRPWAGRRLGHNYEMELGVRPDEPDSYAEDLFFILRVQVGEAAPQLRFLVVGESLAHISNGNMSRLYKYAHVPTVRAIESRVRWPFVELTYVDDSLPVSIKLTAWTPFIPGQDVASSTPGFCLDFEVGNRTDEAVQVSLLGAAANLSGHGVEELVQKHERVERERLRAVLMEGGAADPKFHTSGNTCFFAKLGEAQESSIIESNPYLENFFISFYRDGHLEGKLQPERLNRVEYARDLKAASDDYKMLRNKCWMVISETLAPSASTQMQFGFSWYFPNHYDNAGEYLGKFYENHYQDSLGVAEALLAKHEAWKSESLAFVENVLEGDLPEGLAISLLDQLNTLSKATWLSKAGECYIWEGLGCCCLNTVDVDHYGSFGLAHLFPKLRRSVTDINGELQRENGQIIHGLPQRRNAVNEDREFRRWDVNLQYLLGVYRDWRWSGHEDLLDAHYERAVRAWRFVEQMDRYGVGLPYIEGGITYDHWHMKGLVTYMAGLFLTASHALAEMAEHRNDSETAQAAREANRKGSESFEKLLWHDDYYALYYLRKQEGEVSIQLELEKGAIAGDAGDFDPHAHLKADCCSDDRSCCVPAEKMIEVRDDGLMTDLLNGEGYAAIVGLPRSLDSQRVRQTLERILERNYERDLGFVVNGTYQDGSCPDEWPFSQWQNPWTGSEYFFAAQLIAEGLTEEGLSIIDAVLERYDREGMRFNHIECSEHYSRPLSIYAVYHAWMGMTLDVPGRRLALSPASSLKQWTLPLISPCAQGKLVLDASSLTIELQDGSLPLETLDLGPQGFPLLQNIRLEDGTSLTAEELVEGVRLRLPAGTCVEPASSLRILFDH